MAACRVAGKEWTSGLVFLAVARAGGWPDVRSFVGDQEWNKLLVRRRLRALAKRHGIVHRRGR